MEAKPRLPYIGVTGFMSRDEVDFVITNFEGEIERQLMVGVLASSKTLKGLVDKWPRRYPVLSRAGAIFSSHPAALNLFHYKTDDPTSLFDQLNLLREFGGPHLNGFQLNITWPDVSQIKRFIKQPGCQDTRIVLQLGSKALNEVRNDPRRLLKRLIPYLPVITDILIDPSGGLGKAMVLEKTREYLDCLCLCCALFPGFGLGVAGGLSSKTVYDLVGPLARKFEDLSTDAEGQLRDIYDNLDLGETDRYLKSALDMFYSSGG